VKRCIVKSALIAVAILFPVSLSFALDSKPAASGESDVPPKMAKEKARRAEVKSAHVAQLAKEKPVDAKAKAAARAKRVDINSASKEQLKKLPGIGDAEADKIIAGRPYLTKADLLTNKVLPDSNYEPIKRLIAAKQKQNPVAKPKQK
jgi:competence protein ComEA